MCRNIKTLYNFEPPATNDEIHEASLQFVRKISGFGKPSEGNRVVFDRAVDEGSVISKKLLDSLATGAKPKNRNVEVEKSHKRAIKRFG